jgi:protein TonB
MLAYAPRPERRRFSPVALSLIVGAHALGIIAVMSAKMDVIRQHIDPTYVELIPETKPEPPKPKPETPHPATETKLAAPDPIIDPPPMPGPTADPLPPTPLPPLPPGPTIDPTPIPRPAPLLHSGPRFATADDDIRPPYPESMRAAEKEARLRLRLSIDERGRVTAVDPVGRAEPAFLAAARRHIIKAWRYKPAMEGGHAVPSTTVIALEFKLNA